MASIHEQVARALVDYLNAGLRPDGSPIYTGPIQLGPGNPSSAQFAWQPYRGKDDMRVTQVLVVPAAEVRELLCRGHTSKQTTVQIAVRQACAPTDEDLITSLDTLSDDIKDGTELVPQADRAWESQTNDPLYPRAQLEETGVYLSVISNLYQFGAS